MVTLLEYRTRPACIEALALARKNFRVLEDAAPRAKWVPWEDDHNWRFTEQLHKQLLIQKLARQITGIQTIDLLLMAGHLQEVGVLYRMLDEIAEDILFIVLGIRTDNWTAHHDNYVRYFWSEDGHDKQPPVRRKTIRAYVNRAFGQSDPARGDATGRVIHKVYSDYVHARSACIMAMVKGPPARFDLDGVHNDVARYPYIEQIPAYFYRCLVSCTAIANVMLPDQASYQIYEGIKSFEQKHAALLF